VSVRANLLIECFVKSYYRSKFENKSLHTKSKLQTIKNEKKLCLATFEISLNITYVVYAFCYRSITKKKCQFVALNLSRTRINVYYSYELEFRNWIALRIKCCLLNVNPQYRITLRPDRGGGGRYYRPRKVGPRFPRRRLDLRGLRIDDSCYAALLLSLNEY